MEAKMQANGVQIAKSLPTAQCWTKKKTNPVEGEEQQQSQTQQDQSNNRDPDFEDSINSFYQSKN
jgi:hypothetical protein